MAKKKVAIVSSIGVGVLVIGAIITWLFVSGRVTLVINQSDEMVKGPVVLVCGDETIKAFNEASTGYPTDDPMTSAIDTAALVKVADAVKKKSNYKQDPTCQTILFWTAIQERKYEEAKAAKAAVDALQKDGHFANNNLRTTATPSDWQLFVDDLSPETQNVDKSVGDDD
ncbi:hypothetical protein B7Y92_00740 [Candidatus Saccharibacteria bacterium 32-50-13]|nr:MAG: hypothetical protein B7Y92_00740 [Candidatus Saccharibacteria bacterium 32-50-13]